MNVPNQNQPAKKNLMNQNPETDQISDPIFDQAMANFRSSVHSWSDRELARRPATASAVAQPSRWSWLMAPAVSWTAAAVLALAGAGVPLGLHYHNEARPASTESTAHVIDPLPPTPPVTKAEDDKLLEHVDTDIAQDTPDAMQPLASLMSSSGND